jgi:CRP-like cAMP-binding protein
MAALDEAPRVATVVALVDLRALVLPGAAFKELLAERPEIAREVLRVLSARLRGMINPSPGDQA